MKSELKKCPHCNRMNWYERSYCSWCLKKLPTKGYMAGQRLIDVIIVVVSLLALFALLGIVGYKA